MDGRFGYLSAVQKQHSEIEERANIKINFNSVVDCTSHIKRTVCDEHCYCQYSGLHRGGVFIEERLFSCTNGIYIVTMGSLPLRFR